MSSASSCPRRHLLQVPASRLTSSPQANSAAGSAILSLLGVVLDDVTAQIGIKCSPISAVGLGQSSCSAKPVCCENNNVVSASVGNLLRIERGLSEHVNLQGGLISIGCAPVEL